MKSFSRWVAIASVLLVGGGVTLAARNSAGTYSLPVGNPVTSGTTITSTWANSTITDLARALGMETTAEGVENPEQLAELRLHGCSSVQGYLFSRPVDAAGVFEALAAANPQRDVA